jgi:hypothetical protein
MKCCKWYANVTVLKVHRYEQWTSDCILYITREISINRKRNGKLTKTEGISGWKYTRTQTPGNLKYFGDHRCLSPSEESKCMWTSSVMALRMVFERYHQRVARQEAGKVRGLEENYLRLIPGLCLDNRTNSWASFRWQWVIWLVLGAGSGLPSAFQQELKGNC